MISHDLPSLSLIESGDDRSSHSEGGAVLRAKDPVGKVPELWSGAVFALDPCVVDA